MAGDRWMAMGGDALVCMFNGAAGSRTHLMGTGWFEVSANVAAISPIHVTLLYTMLRTVLQQLRPIMQDLIT